MAGSAILPLDIHCHLFLSANWEGWTDRQIGFVESSTQLTTYSSCAASHIRTTDSDSITLEAKELKIKAGKATAFDSYMLFLNTQWLTELLIVTGDEWVSGLVFSLHLQLSLFARSDVIECVS